MRKKTRDHGQSQTKRDSPIKRYAAILVGFTFFYGMTVLLTVINLASIVGHSTSSSYKNDDWTFLHNTDTKSVYNHSKARRTTMEAAMRRAERRKENEVQAADDNVFGGVKARAFDRWNGDFPCFEETSDEWDQVVMQEEFADVGWLMMRPIKAATTTSVGVFLRIMRNQARKKGFEKEVCVNRFSHGVMKPYRYATRFKARDKSKSFLWTILREPTRRHISHFFFDGVSRGRIKVTDTKADTKFIRFLDYWPQSHYHYYLTTLSTRGYNTRELFERDQDPLRRKKDPLVAIRAKLPFMDPIQVANEIMTDYDFIAIMERFDESLVALMMILNLSFADILYLDGKATGGFDDGNTGRCRVIQKSFVSTGMQAYFESAKWRNRVQYDELLYKAANRSLDLTIDKLGRSDFEKNLFEFQRLQTIVRERCQEKAIYPCMKPGKPLPPSETDCLYRDAACGTTCLDEVCTELGLW